MGEVIQFEEFAKIPRLRRECVVTEKLDGTNAQILVVEGPFPYDGAETIDPNAVAVVRTEKYNRTLFAGSRNRWLSPGKSTDNFGFAGWVKENADQLAHLGPGRHYGEWWGQGIQRTYGLDHKRFSLFNVARWVCDREEDHVGFYSQTYLREKFPKIMACPPCCHVVPILYAGLFDTVEVDDHISELRSAGSIAAEGFMNPEGIVVYHTAGNVLFKQTIEKDEEPKSKAV